MPLGPLFVFEVLEVLPSEPGARGRAARAHRAIAPSAEAALATVAENAPGAAFNQLLVRSAQPVAAGLLVGAPVPLPRLSQKQVDALQGPALASRPRVQAQISSQLTPPQLVVLDGLRRTGPYPGGGIWEQLPGTQQVCEGLHKLGLVSLSNARFQLNAAGHSALEQCTDSSGRLR